MSKSLKQVRLIGKQTDLTRSCIANQRGQGLIEYLIIVALMGVATIAIMRVMGETVSNRFATITSSLQGRQTVDKPTSVDKSTYKKRDLGDFMSGAATKGTGGTEGGK